MSITLRGMTWSHPRGYDPLVACSRLWQERTGLEITWDKRSLQDFESYPVEELAARYDLIVIDHPHVGQITTESCLLPLDVAGREADAEALALGSVGASYPSYTYEGRQWAFPIDAATQVQAWRPDLLPAPLAHWDQVLDLARQGGVLCPLRSPHTLMSLYTLTGNLGAPPVVDGTAPLFTPDVAAIAYDKLAALADLIDPACFDWDPIAWDSAAVNAPAGNFYRDTRATLEGAWLRPRHDGYMPFQHEASERLRTALLAKEPAAGVIADLNALYRSTLP
jgi:multiple sugar transport system substrate-binding protein